MMSIRKKMTQVQWVRGIALPSVMVILLLSSLLALTAWRSVWLNELLLRARADAVRSQWAADAALHAALDDVLQHARFSQTPVSTEVALRHVMGTSDQHHVFFPKDASQLMVLRQRLGADDCREGICAPSKPLPSQVSYWQNRANSAMVILPDQSLSPSGKACYWVEVFLRTESDQTPAWIYRITAMVKGLKAAQPVVLQAIWLPDAEANAKTSNATTGQWVSWTRLHD